MKYIIFSILLTCSCLLSFAQADTAFYSVVVKGKITGCGKDWRHGTNEYHSTYQFNDRGRGDSTVSVFYTTPDGRTSSLETRGVDYYKNPYTETFSIQGDSAVWTINGSRKAKKYANQIYPIDQELLIKWIMKQQDQRAEILPDGFMHIAEPIQRRITANGQALDLKMLPIYNEPSPLASYVWTTADFKFFASVNMWRSTIKKGYEKAVDTLLVLQELASQQYYTDELKQTSKVLPSNIVLTHATLFQSETASVKNNMTLEIKNGKITAIYPSSVSSKGTHADTVIDCGGKFLMPGLWDMHGHYQKNSGSFYLSGGVTHVRDMGNDKMLITYKKQIAGNKLLGPDISYLSGLIDKEDPFEAPSGKIIKSLDEGIKAVEDYHRSGYQQIKLYSAIKPEWVGPIAAHAHKLGMRVCGHIPAFMTAEQAINNGYDEITHMNFVFLNFMGDTIDTRTPARFRLVGDQAGKLDLQSQKVNDFIRLMKRKNIALDATMNVWLGMFNEFKGDTAGFLKPVIKWLPQQWLSSLGNQSPFGSEENRSAYQSSFDNMMKMLKRLYDNGILLVAGTDGGEANALHHELELYVQAGIPANEVLKIATYNAAVDCNVQNVYGSIKTGMPADLILIAGNPVSNMSDIRRVELVIKNNLLFQPKQLLSAQGWKYYY
jgi:hypothetical protein